MFAVSYVWFCPLRSALIIIDFPVFYLPDFLFFKFPKIIPGLTLLFNGLIVSLEEPVLSIEKMREAGCLVIAAPKIIVMAWASIPSFYKFHLVSESYRLLTRKHFFGFIIMDPQEIRLRNVMPVREKFIEEWFTWEKIIYAYITGILWSFIKSEPPMSREEVINLRSGFFYFIFYLSYHSFLWIVIPRQVWSSEFFCLVQKFFQGQ